MSWYQWDHDLGAFRWCEARNRKKSDRNVVAVPPNDFAVCYQAVELDDLLEYIGNAHGAGHTQPRSRVGDVAHRAWQGGVTVVERDNAAFQNPSPQRSALVLLSIAHSHD